MEWLNLPLIEIALAFGGIVGLVFGFLATAGVKSWTGYRKGYQRGYEDGRKAGDGE